MFPSIGRDVGTSSLGGGGGCAIALFTKAKKKMIKKLTLFVPIFIVSKNNKINGNKNLLNHKMCFIILSSWLGFF
jgi:mevalonate kinase